MIRPPRTAAFTLIEMITVIAIIAILAGLVLAVGGVAQSKAAKSRAEGEIKQLSSALEAYKTDNGGYPQDPTKTDNFDPLNSTANSNQSKAGGAYANSSLFLYGELTGDKDFNGKPDAGKAANYAPGFFTPSRLGGTKTNGVVSPITYIQDPFGNSYGYSTAGLAAEQDYRQKLSTDPNAKRTTTKGFNPTFDMWSTAGDTSINTAKWIKNW